jgi:pre-rRNA-processing protein TSR4
LPKRFPNHERRLYIFVCRQKTCRRKKGSVRALRSVRSPEIKTGNAEDGKVTTKSKSSSGPSQKQMSNIGESLFSTKSSPSAGNVNLFSTSASSNSPPNPFSNSILLNGNTTKQETVSSIRNSSPGSRNTSDVLPTFAEKLSLGQTNQSTSTKATEPWPNPDRFPPPYPTYFLDADFESLEKQPTEQISQRIEIDQTATGSEQRGEDKEIFESSLDKTFQKFADRLAQNPEQILRYEFDGAPLLFSSQDSVGEIFSKPHSNSSKITTTQSTTSKIPQCVNCGNARVFELQLTPHAILELEAEEPGLEGMEWGTIIVGVCSKDCLSTGPGTGQVGYIEEWVGVQWEEPSSKK